MISIIVAVLSVIFLVFTHTHIYVYIKIGDYYGDLIIMDHINHLYDKTQL